MNTKLNRLFSNCVIVSKRPHSKFLVYLLLIAMVVSLIPIPPGSFASIDNGSSVKQKQGEADTVPTLVDGQVWTGKTVDAGNLTDDIFNVKLEALGQGYKTTIETPKPANVVLVLDTSSSMNDNNKMSNMVTAANQLIDSILATSGNKIAVVQFNSTASVLTDLTSTNYDITLGTSNVNATNLQAGINRGYKILENAKNNGDTALPFMVVLSDGATWYYRTDIANIPTTGPWTEDPNGYNGNGTTNNYGITAAAWTIRQAKYLKTLMPELKLYTIGYGTSGNALTTATLNPTQANIAAVTGSGSSPKRLYAELGTGSAQAAYQQYYYPDGYFASTESLAGLIAAFNEILASIESHPPLDADSVVTITDTIGDDFEITGDLSMKLKSGTYTFTKSGNNYVSNPAAPAGVSVNVNGTQLTWTFPASELPYHAYSTTEDSVNQAAPAVLSFNVELKAGAVPGTKYYTNYNDGNAFGNRTNPVSNAGANAVFTPKGSNPYYYDDEGKIIENRVDAVTGKATLYMKNTGMIELETTIGDLTIKKNVVAYDGTNKGPLADDEDDEGFEFTVSVGNFEGTGYIYDSEGDKVGTFGITNGSATLTLKDGEYAVISGISVGTEYTVTEKDYSDDGYVTTVSGNASGTVAEVADPVVFTNTYYPSAEIVINKEIETLYDGVAVPDGVEFPFGLYKAAGDAYEKVANASASVTTSDGGKSYSATMTVKIKDLADLGLFDESDSVTLYVHEEPLSGEGLAESWVQDPDYYEVTINKDGTVEYPDTDTAVTMTNKYEPLSQLSLTKSTDGNSDKMFEFTIEIGTLDGYPYEYSLTVGGEQVGETLEGTGTGSAVSFVVSLAHNETAVINGIPVGTPYTVTEKDYSSEGYYSDLPDNETSGIIDIDETKNHIEVNNTYESTDLTISKVVAGIETTTQFNFEVSYGSTPESFALKDGESKTLEDVPVGATYTVKETPIAGYKTDVSMIVGDADPVSLSYNSSTGGYTFTLTEEATEIVFTNTFKEGQLTVSKIVVGEEPEGSEYGIQVTFTGSNLLDEINAVVGSETVTDNNGVFDITLKNGEYAVFTDIPEGVAYTVVETDSGSADSISYTYVDDKEMISDGDQNEVIVTNTYETPSQLIISKIVPQAAYSALKGDERFGFSISFFKEELFEPTEGAGDPELTRVPYELKNFEMPALLGGADPDFDGADGNYTFTLAAGESLVFNNLPVGVKYEVEETDDEGARTSLLKVNGVDQTGLIATGTITGNAENQDAIDYYNWFNIDTGKLILKKAVTGNKKVAPDSFRFEVTFKGQTDVTLPGHVGVVGDDSITFNLSLGRYGFAVFSGIKAGTEYEITEFTNADSRSFTPNSKGEFELYRSGWRVKDVKVTCTNDYAVPKTVTVKDAYDGQKLISDFRGGVYVDDVVTYKIKVTNKGPHPVTLERIKDAMFGTITLEDIVSVNGPGGAIAPFSLSTIGEGKYLEFTDGVELNAGESVTVIYDTKFDSAGIKTNTAKSYASYNHEFNEGESGALPITSKDDAKIKVFNKSGLEIDKVVSAGDDTYANLVTVDYKDPVTYKITASNTGQGKLSRVAITDYQLTKENVISVTLNGTELNGSGEDPDYTIKHHVLRLKKPLKPGEEIVVLYSVEATKNYLNIAFMSAHDGLNTLKDKDAAKVKVRFPEILVEKTGDKGTVITGESVDYTIRIENTYDHPLDLVSVTDSFFRFNDENEDYTVSDIRYSVDGGTPVEIPMDSAMIDPVTGTISFGTVDGEEITYPEFDEDVVITYTVTFHKAGTYVNDADAVAGFRGYLVNGGDDYSVRVKDPSGVLVTKKVNGQDEVTVSSGTVVTYSARVENKGKVDLNLSTFEDAIFATSGVDITKLVLIDGDIETPLTWHQDEADKKIIYIDLPESAPEEVTLLLEEGSDETDWLFLKPGMSVLLTYTKAMTADYTNTVIATLYEADETVLTDDDSARVRIRRPDRPDRPDPDPDPDPIIIPEDPIPEGPVVIPEEEIPQGPVPKTGVDDNTGLMAILMIGSLAGIGILTRRRRASDK
jgi:LPXTG-motif cell wall-anchored protein